LLNLFCTVFWPHYRVSISLNQIISMIAAVIARQFSHPFFRCAINVGLLVITADTDRIETNDLLTVDLTKSVIFDQAKGVARESHTHSGPIER